jgi:hypothetical protein
MARFMAIPFIVVNWIRNACFYSNRLWLKARALTLLNVRSYNRGLFFARRSCIGCWRAATLIGSPQIIAEGVRRLARSGQ